MSEMEILVSQWKKARKDMEALKQKIHNEKSKILYHTEKYHQKEGREMRNKVVKLEYKMQDLSQEIEDLEIKLKNLDYEFLKD